MDIETFYEALLPPQGMRALVAFVKGLKSAPRQTFFETDTALIAAATRADQAKVNVYHGCATFKDPGSRKADNVLAVKALWVDIDVGPGKQYEDRRSAVEAILDFQKKTGLQRPWIVGSGSGVHVYFTLTVAVPPVQWQMLADSLAGALVALQVRYDSSRTQDAASILRVPGTGNYKTDPPKQVRIILAGENETPEKVLACLQKYPALPSPAAAPGAQETNELVGAPKEYPPSKALVAARKCAVLEEVFSTGGDVPYEVWWRAQGVIKHCADAEEAGAAATSRRAESHEQTDWQKIHVEWPAGPTSCAEFAKHSSRCQECPNRLTGNGSPIIHGQVDEEVLRTTYDYKAPELLTALQSKLGIVVLPGGKLAYAPDGAAPAGWCDRYWQVVNRVRDENGTWVLEIKYDEDKGNSYRSFYFDSSSVTNTDALKKAFSAHELHIYSKYGMKVAMDKLRYEQELLYDYDVEVKTYPLMGWVTEDNIPRGTPTGEFVIGSTLYSPGEKPKEIVLSERVYQDLRMNFKTAGTVDRWVTIVDNIYNRKGAEAYQFVIAAMFASPLVALVPGAGAWHGIPIALYGDSGAAKTSTALVGMSIYAPPQTLLFNANSQKDGQGDTVNAFAIKVGTLQNIPFVADEMTGLDPEKMSAIMYMLANGKSKDRSSTQGVLIQNPHRWDLISLCTGNEGFHAKLEQLRNKATQEASQLRCFEIQLHEEDLRKVFPDVTRDYVEHELLGKQYGMVGRKWLQAVVKNRLKISEMLGKERATFKIEDDDRSAIRFYKDLLICVRVASLLAKKMGLIHWDIDRMMNWAKERVDHMAKGVYVSNWEGIISNFIASLNGRTIVTRKFKFGPGRRGNPEMPLEIITNNQLVVARRAIDDRVFAVAQTGIQDWCRDNRIPYDLMLEQMKKMNYLQSDGNDKPTPKMLSLGSGTTVPRPPAPCFLLDYHRCVDYQEGEDDVGSGAPDNVVPLSVAAGNAVSSIKTTTSSPSSDEQTSDVAV